MAKKNQKLAELAQLMQIINSMQGPELQRQELAQRTSQAEAQNQLARMGLELQTSEAEARKQAAERQYGVEERRLKSEEEFNPAKLAALEAQTAASKEQSRLSGEQLALQGKQFAEQKTAAEEARKQKEREMGISIADLFHKYPNAPKDVGTLRALHKAMPDAGFDKMAASQIKSTVEGLWPDYYMKGTPAARAEHVKNQDPEVIAGLEQKAADLWNAGQRGEDVTALLPAGVKKPKPTLGWNYMGQMSY